jgi:transcriptional regulator with XRE-family HTH domain
MSVIWSKRLFNKLTNKKYRSAYVEENVQTGIAYQLRTLRGELSQEEFGKKIDKPQSVVSRIEDPDYGKLSVQTLLDIATSLDIALLVKFVSFPEFIQQTRDVSIEGLQVPSFEESLKAYKSLTTLKTVTAYGESVMANVAATDNSAAVNMSDKYFSQQQLASSLPSEVPSYA